MAGMRQDDLDERMKVFVTKSGAGTVILCRCDTKESIEWGQKSGIRLFQGRIVETLIESTANAGRQAHSASYDDTDCGPIPAFVPVCLQVFVPVASAC